MPQPHTVLRGPADADHFRVKVGRYHERWYTDPLGESRFPGHTFSTTSATWPSVSNVKKASGSDWTMTGLKRVSKAIQDRPTLAAELNGMKPADRYDRLKAINTSGLRDASSRGTNVHKMFERGLQGLDYIYDPTFDGPEGATFEPAVQAFLDTYQPELVAAELVCINRGLNADLVNDRTRRARPEFEGGYGGTGDGIIKINGKLYFVDWKSRGDDSDHGAYPEEAMQLGAYGSADYYIAEGPNGPVRIPVPHLDGGLIISVKSDGCRVYDVDLDDAAEQWQGLHAWWIRRLTERQPIGRAWAPRSVPATERVMRAVAETAAADADADPFPLDVPVSDADLATASDVADEFIEAATTIQASDEFVAHVKTATADLGNMLDADLELLIIDAPDVSTLNAIWALHRHKWTDHHTVLAKETKAALAEKARLSAST